MPRALLSVFHKKGVVELARGLIALGYDLIASGGTLATLIKHGVEVTPVEKITGAPEMLDGRVKTLHPAVHAGLLARDTEADMAELAAHGYTPIDLVACNLYPFNEVISSPNVTLALALDYIDIGGVTLLRAAAKNFPRVTVLCDPSDYEPTLLALQRGSLSELDRKQLAVKAFAHTRDYDAAVADYLMAGTAQTTSELPQKIAIRTHERIALRYGENPHQTGAFYPTASGLLGGELVGGGKELSYNNLLDLDSAWRTTTLYSEPTCVIVKHLNPCGIAQAQDAASAYQLALECDPVSAFGGVIALNVPANAAFVRVLEGQFVEAIIAPSFTAEAVEHLQAKHKNCRLVQANDLPAEQYELRSVRGGILAQSVDTGDPAVTEWRVVTKRAPTEAEQTALKFTWKAAQSVKSNAIVLGKALLGGYVTVGIGGGLPSRVDAARLAVEKAGARAHGSVMASDAFFPFSDGLEVGIKAGVTAVIAPGGSKRDAEVIAAADAANIAMIFTGVRHFRH